MEYSSTPSVPPLALATREEDNCDRGGVSGLSVLRRVGLCAARGSDPPLAYAAALASAVEAV